MCIPLGGMGQQLLVPPTDQGRKLADYLRVVLLLHFILAFFLLMSMSWIDGVLDVIGALIGFLAIKNREAFNFQYVLCYCIFTGFDFFWAVIRLILFFAGVTEMSSDPAWQYYMRVGVIIAGPIIYFLACFLSYKLYTEMRRQMEPGLAGDDGAPGYYGQQPQQNVWRHEPAHPAGVSPVAAAQPSGFRPFSGTGHKLGGT